MRFEYLHQRLAVIKFVYTCFEKRDFIKTATIYDSESNNTLWHLITYLVNLTYIKDKLHGGFLYNLLLLSSMKFRDYLKLLQMSIVSEVDAYMLRKEQLLRVVKQEIYNCN